MLTIENNQKTIKIAFNGQPLLRYQADTPASKPHFDRVALPPTAEARAGENIVLAAPHDHVWHLGLFFSPGFLDGLNFCESERLAAGKERYGECRSTGRISSVVKDDGSVAFSHEIRWRTGDDQTWMTEQRDITVHAPRGNAYRIDWKMAWTAVGKDRIWTSAPTSGSTAGPCFRVPRSMDGAAGQVLSREGANTIETVQGHKARWCDYTGKLDGKMGSLDPDTAGITLMDHPQNPNHPNAWYAAIESCGLLAADWTAGASGTIKKDESRTFRFGILVHYGRPDRDRIESEYRTFAEWT
jgi:hypothetical protein